MPAATRATLDGRFQFGIDLLSDQEISLSKAQTISGGRKTKTGHDLASKTDLFFSL
jgi:hypothetical protein